MNVEKHLFDVITTAAGSEDPPYEAVNRSIEAEIAAAVPTTFRELGSLRLEDGNNFVITVDRDIVLNRRPFDFADKKITLTIRGSGNSDSIVEDITFPGGKKSPFQIGKGTVLILENIVLEAKRFIRDGVVQVNGGILVFKRAAIINQCYEQRCNGFTCGESINTWYLDVIESNGQGIVYGYENPSLFTWPWERE